MVDRFAVGDRSRPPMLPQHLARRVLTNEARFGSQAFNLAFTEERGLLFPAIRVTGKLDAG
jgi:hypothetical protein